MGLSKARRDFIELKATQENLSVTGRAMSSKQMAGPRTSAPKARMLSGAELATIHPVLEEIPDPVLRRKVTNSFSIYTKYQALRMLTDDSSEVMQKYPEKVARILEMATETDYAVASARIEVF